MIGEPVTFNVSVKPAPNFPLDLYLLMDLSYSMRDDLNNLKELGSQIGTFIEYVLHFRVLFNCIFTAVRIGNITTNYRLGFGAFVDKPIAPYVDITPDR